MYTLSMLSPRRRHLKTCKHRSSLYLKCKCPLWAIGTLDGAFVRKSLDTRNLEKAVKMIADMEKGILRVNEVGVRDGLERFLADCRARKLSRAILKKYEYVSAELTQAFGNQPLRTVSVDDLRVMREQWTYASSTARKRVEYIRTFFSFCVASGWIQQNPAKGMKPPKVSQSPTLPYSEEEWAKILWALDTYGTIHAQTPKHILRQLKALVLVMRYSGLRVSDAVSLKRERVDASGRLFLYQAKTGNPVQIPLPKIVLQALGDCDEGQPFYFWLGVGTLTTALTHWQGRFQKLFAIAGVSDGHSHRFRDSFAVDLLSLGVSLETVSILLGHTNIATTQKHYAPWVASRQNALEAAVKKTWA